MTDIFDFSSTTQRFAVIGNPITHSRSPEIHQMFAEQLGFDLEYEAIQVDPGGVSQALRNLQASGFKGLNVTVPFKKDVHELADCLTSRARVATAVNTVKFEPDQTIFGDNTDGIGLVRDLEHNLGWEIRNSRILLIGAGGAARGVLEPLLLCKPAKLVITNRTADRAFALANAFSSYGPIEALSRDQLRGSVFDAVINATAASLADERPVLPDKLFSVDSLAYDMMYGADCTPFMSWSKEQGAAKVVDGFGMLVEQAAESFTVWHGIRPRTDSVFGSLHR